MSASSQGKYRPGFFAGGWRLLFKAMLPAVLCSAAAVVQAQATAQAAAICPPVAQAPTSDQLQAGVRSARDRGFLWRIAKDGRESYLFGTIHIGKLEWAFPGEKVRGALMATDTLALEVDVTDPELRKRMAPGAAASGAAARAPLDPALMERIGKQLDAACLPRPRVAQLHPVMQAATLSILSARWDGLDPSFGQEIVLAGFARAAQRPIVSLESPELQMKALVPVDPAKGLLMVDQMIAQLETGKTRATLVRMGEAWAAGNLAEMENYESWCDCTRSDEERAFLKRVNDDRNPNLADRIDALHRDGKKVFAAVGALHMTGPQALPKLMAQRGYTVEPVEYTR